MRVSQSTVSFPAFAIWSPIFKANDVAFPLASVIKLPFKLITLQNKMDLAREKALCDSTGVCSHNKNGGSWEPLELRKGDKR